MPVYVAARAEVELGLGAVERAVLRESLRILGGERHDDVAVERPRVELLAEAAEQVCAGIRGVRKENAGGASMRGERQRAERLWGEAVHKKVLLVFDHMPATYDITSHHITSHHRI